jgi:DNA-binding MarR family transcriptional regulator
METLEKYLALRSFVNETEKRGLVYGTSFSEFLILRAINEQGAAGIRRVDLAEQVGLTISGVTRAIAPLEKQGYVETLDEATDARVRKVTMTKTGATLFEDMEKDVERRMIAIHSNLQKMLREITA